jgi:hypothetical protein
LIRVTVQVCFRIDHIKRSESLQLSFFGSGFTKQGTNVENSLWLCWFHQELDRQLKLLINNIAAREGGKSTVEMVLRRNRGRWLAVSVVYRKTLSYPKLQESLPDERVSHA